MKNLFNSHWLQEQVRRFQLNPSHKTPAWQHAEFRKQYLEDMLKRKDLKPEQRQQFELKLKHDLEIIREHENDLAIQELALQLYCKKRQLPAPKPQWHQLKL